MGRPYIKEIYITVKNIPCTFKFMIVWNYGEYIIYPIRYPGMHKYNSTSHEAHLLTDSQGKPIVCWDREITNFDDANAIMFVWAKQYAKMYYGNVQGRKKPRLPSGVFRNCYVKEINDERST